MFVKTNSLRCISHGLLDILALRGAKNINKNNRLRNSVWCVGMLSLSVSLTFAQQVLAQPNVPSAAQTVEGPTFDIKRFELTGNTLL